MGLNGTYTALITPFAENGDIDWNSLKNLVRQQVESGIEGLVPCGTTGESPTLDHKEHEEVIARVTEWAREIRPDITIIAGTGSNSTAEAIRLTRAAARDGADYALVVNPYYNKPVQKGLLEHFKAIADSSEIPVIVYNIPGRTAVSLSLDTLTELAGHENICGVKEATGDLGFMASLLERTRKMNTDFDLLSGDDNLLLPVLSIGGTGVISVISNLLPRETGEITRNFQAGNAEQAREQFFRMLPLCQLMFCETNPIPVKYAASLLGLCRNVLRLPMTSLDTGKMPMVKEALEKFMNQRRPA